MAKAQIASLDVFIALSIVTLVLVTFFSVFNYTYEKNIMDLEYKEMAEQALAISDTLIKTPGTPYNWDITNVQVFGLAEEDRIISRQKAESFCSIPDSESARVLGVSYLFYFSVGNISCGRVPTGNKIAVIERNVFFEGQDSKLNFVLWR